ncbi:MAG TPA: ATP-binding protein [Polyangiales bacterium]
MSDLPALELQMADAQRIDDLVDREALGEVCRSFFDLFGLPIRLFSAEGALLADVHQQRSICSYLNGLPEGRLACGKTVSDVRARIPESGEVVHPCFTGAVYRVVPILYDGRRLGRFVVGPYLPAELREVPRSLLQIDPGVDPERAKNYLNEMPRVRRETADKITAHLGRVLDLILFSGHRAYLTSNMHLASVRANFRELAEKNQRLQHAYDRLKELDRLKSDFLATMSHELRTPLTSIIGYSEMLASGMGGELNQEQQEFVGTIRNKGDHLLELITNLLDMSKFEQGTILLKKELFDPARLVEEVARTIAPAAKKKGVSVEQYIAPNLPRVVADPARMRQVLQNLTDNALKFTPSGGKITLEVSAVDGQSQSGETPLDDGAGLVLMMAPQRYIQFAVRDTGIGIAPSEQERVFDAFYQVDSSATREHGGTGLGLSIVKRLVEAHNGTVGLDSALGRGTTFYVRLPEAEPI